MCVWYGRKWGSGNIHRVCGTPGGRGWGVIRSRCGGGRIPRHRARQNFPVGMFEMLFAVCRFTDWEDRFRSWSRDPDWGRLNDEWMSDYHCLARPEDPDPDPEKLCLFPGQVLPVPALPLPTHLHHLGHCHVMDLRCHLIFWIDWRESRWFLTRSRQSAVQAAYSHNNVAWEGWKVQNSHERKSKEV